MGQSRGPEIAACNIFKEVVGAHLGRREHGAHPELAGDEGREAEAGEKPSEEVGGGGGDEDGGVDVEDFLMHDFSKLVSLAEAEAHAKELKEVMLS
ncbi:uncharacterized protein A4U43_C08F34600 [Asparagus officinalis]|nr:uncharacterized protein A4U43_C08F34600 [Asparagus officinalis]